MYLSTSSSVSYIPFCLQNIVTLLLDDKWFIIYQHTNILGICERSTSWSNQITLPGRMEWCVHTSPPNRPRPTQQQARELFLSCNDWTVGWNWVFHPTAPEHQVHASFNDFAPPPWFRNVWTRGPCTEASDLWFLYTSNSVPSFPVSLKIFTHTLASL